MPDINPELPPSPPTPQSGPVIDPSSTAVPVEPRPTAPVPPSTARSPWYPHFDTPSAAPAGLPPMGTAPARARRTAAETRSRTRAVVGGASVVTFLAVLAAIGIHDRSQPASNTTGGDGASTSFDPGIVVPNLSGGGTGLDTSQDPFSGRFSGGFSATPGSGGTSSHTRSHGS